jgi:UDP-2-acetamido-3-amino-2,3-dideoxy-glucuronate N-acetyltransferase
MTYIHPSSNIYDSAKIGEDCSIGAFVEIGKNVVIGDRCRIGTGAYIPENVQIGNDVFIAPHVVFTNDKNPPSNGKWRETSPTLVKDGVTIGANSTILPSLVLMDGCQIGAGSVVTKDVDVGRLVYGNPARLKTQ